MMRWIGALLITFVVAFAPAQAQQTIRHVVLISIDGLTAPTVSRLTDAGFETPNLQSLVRRGIVAKALIPTTPANTFPNHTTMITGVSAARHGILDNDQFDPMGPAHGLFYHYYDDIAVPTLFDAVREAGLTSAAIWWPVTTGAPIDYLLTDIPGDVPERGKFVYATSSDNIRAVLGSPQRAEAMTDELRLEAAVAALAMRPAFTAIHFTELDSAEHDHGVESEEAHAALRATDRHIGEILKAITHYGMAASTAILIVSDHGFQRLHSAIALGPWFVEAGLIEINEKGRIERWEAYPWPGGGAAAIYIRPGAPPDTATRVETVVARLQSHPDDLVAGVYRGEDHRATGGYPDAAMIVNLRDGYAFRGELNAPFLQSGTRSKGVHGFVPTEHSGLGAFVMVAPGISPGRIATARMEDVAQTIASMLGLPLPDAAGTNLWTGPAFPTDRRTDEPREPIRQVEKAEEPA